MTLELRKLSRRMLYVSALSLTLSLSSHSVMAQDRYASVERADAAKGHFSRARAMLVEALAEFEQGRRLANPNLLLDSEEWRLSVITRAEELNRVLDPQPRVTRSGVRFKATSRLIDRARRKLPIPSDGPMISNTEGEEKYMREKREAEQRGALNNPIEARQAPVSTSADQAYTNAQPAAPTASRQAGASQQEVLVPDTGEITADAAVSTEETDEAVRMAIERQIRDRLEDLATHAYDGELPVDEKEREELFRERERQRERLERESARKEANLPAAATEAK